jgi:hypothetical protein
VATGLWAPDSSKVSFVVQNSPEEKSKGFVSTADGRDIIEIQPVEGFLSNISWSADSKELYITSSATGTTTSVFKAKADGTGVQKLIDLFYGMEATPDGKYLLGIILNGKDVGIYELSLADNKRIALLPGVETFMVRMSADKKAFLYSVAGRGEISFYRQEWKDGQLIGQPKLAMRLPLQFPLQYFGNAYDFSPDLSKIVYAKPGGQADFYLMSFEDAASK